MSRKFKGLSDHNLGLDGIEIIYAPQLSGENRNRPHLLALHLSKSQRNLFDGILRTHEWEDKVNIGGKNRGGHYQSLWEEESRHP